MNDLAFITSFDEHWQVEVKKYYNTVNIIVVLKRPLDDVHKEYRLWLSIVIEDDQGRPSMRLRRRAITIDSSSLFEKRAAAPKQKIQLQKIV